ncbi:hypothetical protein [Acaryochloris marina]|uniref:hypothetical protein n=1 Tax=Acaryochloris marina TaxID=155978 RepID=UPI0020173F80|nr:hypothetical protein [Acaryochloris marina]
MSPASIQPRDPALPEALSLIQQRDPEQYLSTGRSSPDIQGSPHANPYPVSNRGEEASLIVEPW